MYNDKKYIKPKKASELLGVNLDTLRRMATRKEINFIRTDSGRYLYDVSTFIGRAKTELQKRKKICYARVSGRGQKSDLENQIALLRQKFPEAEIISDYGSGLNFKRKGLRQILDYAYKGELEEIVVTYKDRLCRFGFEIFEYIFETQSNARIVVLNRCNNTAETELCADMLSIITIFSARMHGLRKYKKQIQEDKGLFSERVQTEGETDDRSI